MFVPGAQLFGTTNPDDPAHWLKRDYLDRLAELPDWRSFAFTLDDNPSLSAEYRACIRREYTGLWFRGFILGEWVAAEGAVFDMWAPRPARRAVGRTARPAAPARAGVNYRAGDLGGNLRSRREFVGWQRGPRRTWSQSSTGIVRAAILSPIVA
ncbi:hypothetical protein [Amycolatopsis sp. RTGN1]|uniref:hypothetical protein n=1 Tax=Amycolatopsis ponsaeliensis TaxID=2992142 RepID=UPI00254E480E|nr:hypothetical protein [Amycolatopsis sp. RTGN1]